jgi:CO dehydrogenase nickel-insertion accessory protein CooC1
MRLDHRYSTRVVDVILDTEDGVHLGRAMIDGDNATVTVEHDNDKSLVKRNRIHIDIDTNTMRVY